MLDEGSQRPKFVARCWGVYAKPTTREDRFISALEREFPDSDWIEEAPAVINGEPMVLEMAVIGPGPGPKNVLGTDGVVYPYRKFKALRGTQIGPPSASTLPSASSIEEPTGGSHGVKEPLGSAADTLSKEGTGAQYDYAVFGSGKVDAPALEKWLKKIPKTATIVTCEPRARKDGHPMNTEALLVELRPDTHVPPLREDLYGDKAKECQAYEAFALGATKVLLGTGGRAGQIRKKIKSMMKIPSYENERRKVDIKIPFEVLELGS